MVNPKTPHSLGKLWQDPGKVFLPSLSIVELPGTIRELTQNFASVMCDSSRLWSLFLGRMRQKRMASRNGRSAWEMEQDSVA